MHRVMVIALLILLLAGCGQKGPLYREALVTDSEPAAQADIQNRHRSSLAD